MRNYQVQCLLLAVAMSFVAFSSAFVSTTSSRPWSTIGIARTTARAKPTKNPTVQSTTCFVRPLERTQLSATVEKNDIDEPSATAVKENNNVAAATDIDIDIIKEDPIPSATATSTATSAMESIMKHAKDVFSDDETEFLTMEMPDHRPLGCTVEESMESDGKDRRHTFVTKVVPGGFAEQAGLQVGDVVLAVTGSFGDVTSVLEAGVEKIKSLVSAVPEEDPLTLHVARGTGVSERHESAIVDLCQTPGANDKEVEDCVVDFLTAGYFDQEKEDEERANNTMEDLCDNDDDEAECMLDGMMNMWANELPPPPISSGDDDDLEGTSIKAKVKPWSSRSSGSGTYVRDPATGEMRNIDA